MKKYAGPLLMLAVFETVAVTLWLTKDNLFYLFNFSYIGISIALGLFLFANQVKCARRVVQFLVGTYMLVYLGLISNENMQIEGFWYYLFTGVFEAATIHYAVAKIFGPLLFGRGWCGYACWTAMILDLLPWKVPREPRKPYGWLRYVTFVLAFAFVAALFVLRVGHLERIMFWCFLLGNAAYYAAGIALAYVWKDNRAFCKYLCPVAVFLKPASYFSLLRIRCDKSKCVDCGKCKKVCPMNVDMTDNARTRQNGTECILCMECVQNCPKKALDL
ncbi:MAG: 4Fe-4S dicluster domain-containing protein [Clostridia bacterium]|nr:4Fe-4S dicluster domain-containing protein [Clostridia bacterium]